MIFWYECFSDARFISTPSTNKTEVPETRRPRRALARLSVPAHLAPAKIRALADAVHEGLVETCGVPPNDRFQLVSTYAQEMMFIDPTFPDVARTPEASIIEILFLQGRTADQKRNLFRRIADRAVSAGFSGDDVMIALIENAPVDWSHGRGLAFGDHHAAMAASPASTR